MTRSSHPALVIFVLVASCGGPAAPILEATFPDAVTLPYAAQDPAGAPSALRVDPIVDANSLPAFSQVFTSDGSNDPRAKTTFHFGHWTTPMGPPLFPMGSNNGRVIGPDMEEVRFELTFSELRWLGDPVTPYLFSGTLGSQLPGKVALAPRCAKDGAVSNYGCGFVPPAGTTSGTITWSTIPAPVPAGMADGCPGKGFYEDAITGAAWTYDGKTLDLGAGRRLACLTTGTGGVVCHDSRQLNLTKDINGLDCGWTVTTLAYPEFTGAAPADHPRFWAVASMNDQSITTGCYGFSWCTVGF